MDVHQSVTHDEPRGGVASHAIILSPWFVATSDCYDRVSFLLYHHPTLGAASCDTIENHLDALHRDATYDCVEVMDVNEGGTISVLL